MKMNQIFKPLSDGKFGTIEGVFIPNVLQMIGAIFFLRLGWILGHVGIAEMGIIISLSSFLLILTSLSMTAIVTNMRMRAGGAYYIISRSLGIGFGSAIGILQCVSQLATIALCVSGFSLSIHEIYSGIPIWLIQGLTIFALLVVTYISTNFALKTQGIIFIGLCCSIGSIFIAFTEIPENLELMDKNPAILTFWAAFSMFFPAITGIESGMAMSGDLRNPSRSLSIGTISSVISVFFLYLGTVFFLNVNVDADFLKTCPFIFYHIHRFSFLILLGVWLATLSSALGSLLGGPRVVQAIARDRGLPRFLARGSGPTNQPRVATLFVFIIAMVLTLCIDINEIIPILTMSCLVSYTLINFIAFFESFLQNPSWRPSFRIHWGVPLVGGVGCFVAMFMISPGITFSVLALVCLFCFWTSRRKINGNWNDIRYGLVSFFVNKAAMSLSLLTKSAKNWRPQILVFFDSGIVHKNLAFFAQSLNQEKGLLTFATNYPAEHIQNFRQELEENLKSLKILSHVHVSRESDPVLAATNVIENYGFGPLRPNTVMFPVPTASNQDSFVRLLLNAHEQEKNIILLNTNSNNDLLFRNFSQQNKQIDLWWRGKYPGNFELCLAMAFLLQHSAFWFRSKISIKMITKDKDSRSALFEQFQKYQKRLRIRNLEFVPIQDPEGDFFSNLAKASPRADLTFLGLRNPDIITSVEEYKDYYARIIEKTRNLGNIAYVLSGEKVKFRNIFL